MNEMQLSRLFRYSLRTSELVAYIHLIH